jgi:hypothetical protein
LTEQQTSIDVPNLLVKAGIVSSHDLSEAVQVSKRLQIPVSRVLITSGAFTETVFWMAIDLQHLMDDELINLESACNSIKRVAGGKSSPDQVLDEIYSLPRFGQGSKSLAELLKMSEIITDEQIEQAYKECSVAGVSLGTALIVRGTLSAGFFPAILRVQDHLFKGRIDAAEAKRQLLAEHEVWKKAEESQRNAVLQTEQNTVRRTAHQSQTAQGLPAYQVPTSGNMNNAGAAPPNQHNVAYTGAPQPTSGAPLGAPPPLPTFNAPPPVQAFDSMREFLSTAEKSNSHNFAELLKAAGYLDSKDIQSAYSRAFSDPTIAAKVFHAAGLINESDIKNVTKVHECLKKGQLSEEEALRALRFSKENGTPIETVLDDLGGWTIARARAERSLGAIQGFVAGCALGAIGTGLLIISGKPGRRK